MRKIKIFKYRKRSLAFVLAAVLSFSILSSSVSLARAAEVEQSAEIIVAGNENFSAVPGKNDPAEQAQTPPAEQMQPSEDSEEVEQIKPSEGTEEAEQTKPSEGTEEVEQTKPSEGTEEAEQAKPSEGTEEAEQPQSPEVPMLPLEPVLPAESLIPMAPAEPVIPQASTPSASEDSVGEDEVDFPVFAPVSLLAKSGDNRYVTSIDLEHYYKPSSIYSTHGGTPISYYPDRGAGKPNKLAPPYTIGSNYFKLGSHNYRAGGNDGTKQVVTMTTNGFTVNFRRPFVIDGYINIQKGADGFAIGFHPARDFNVNNTGGSFGFYKHPNNNVSKGDGLGNATVMEVDTWHNWNDGEKAYAEPQQRKAHISIIETLDNGQVDNQYSISERPGLKSNSYFDPAYGQNVYFKIEYNPIGTKDNIKFTYGDKVISAGLDDGSGIKLQQLYKLKEFEKDGRGHISFSASVDMKEVSRNVDYGVLLQLDNFRYTDIEPKIAVEPYRYSSDYVGQKLDYVMPQEQFSVLNYLINQKNTQTNIDDFLFMDTLKPDWLSSPEKIPLDSTVDFYTEEGRWYKDYDSQNVFDDRLIAYFRSENHTHGAARYRYKITVPEGLALGEQSKITYKYRSGVLGMTQIVHEGSIPVRAQNLITSNNNHKIDFVQVGSPEEITEAKLWENIQVKSSADTSNQLETLAVGQKKAQGMNVTYEYFADGQKVNQKFPAASEIQKGKVYAIKVTITDENGDDRLTNSVTKLVYAADHVNKTDKQLILANNSQIPVSETQLNVMNMDTFKEDVLKYTSAAAYTITDDGVIKNDVVVDFANPQHKWTNSAGTVLDKEVGKHPVHIYTKDNPALFILPEQEVTDNTWSYDDGSGNDTTDGVPGYIIIPRFIELKKGDDKLTGESTVKFAQYDSDKTYSVSVNRVTSLKSVKTPDKFFEVFAQGQADPNGGDRVVIGNLSKTNPEQKFTLQSGPEALDITNVEDTWVGQLTFTFKLMTP